MHELQLHGINMQKSQNIVISKKNKVVKRYVWHESIKQNVQTCKIILYVVHGQMENIDGELVRSLKTT